MGYFAEGVQLTPQGKALYAKILANKFGSTLRLSVLTGG